MLTLESGRAVSHSVAIGGRGDVLIDGRPESAVEITAGLTEGAVVLRGTVGAMRDGTRLTLGQASAVPALAPATSASASPAASAPR